MLYVVFGVLFIIIGLLTAAEMATFSARPDRMRQLSDQGSPSGKLVLVYQRSPVSFLAAGQVLATAGSFAVGAIMQAQVVPSLSTWLGTFLPFSTKDLDAVAAILALTAFTILALILTNVVPKQIGFDHADKVAPFFARPFRFLIRLTRPIAWIVTVVSRFFEILVNRSVRHTSRVTEADILTLVAEGIRIGSLDARETQFVKNALRLSDMRVKDVMTTIERIDGVDVTWPNDRIDNAVRSSDRSYLYAYRSTLDAPAGVLRARDWLAAHRGTMLLHLLQPIETISDDASAVALFELLHRREIRMVAAQHDGRTVGIVTINDALSLLRREETHATHPTPAVATP